MLTDRKEMGVVDEEVMLQFLVMAELQIFSEHRISAYQDLPCSIISGQKKIDFYFVYK